MAISYVGHASAATTSVTLPTTQLGDLIVIFAHRTATTAPTLPTGYTNLTNSSGNSNSFRVGYKWAAGSDTSGTWTNATLLQAVVYRGVGYIGANTGQTNAAATTTAIPTITLQQKNGTSWVVAFAASGQATSQGTPLAGATTSRGTQVGTTEDSIAADTNAGVTSFSATTSANGSSAVSSGVSLELVAAPLIQTIVDPFHGTTVNATYWYSYTGGSATLTETPTGINSTMPSSATASSASDVTSVSGWSFVNSGIYMRVQSIFAVGTHADATMLICDNASTAGAAVNGVQFVVEAGTLFAQKVVAGTQTTVSSVTYNPAVHVWWRIREGTFAGGSAGTVYWDTSVDGITWTNFTSLADPYVMTTQWITISGACYEAETNAGTFTWDLMNCNIPVGKDISASNNNFGARLSQGVNRLARY